MNNNENIKILGVKALNFFKKIVEYFLIFVAKFKMNLEIKNLEKSMKQEEYQRQHIDDAGMKFGTKIKIGIVVISIGAFLFGWIYYSKILTILITLILIAIKTNFTYMLNKGIYDFKWILKYQNQQQEWIDPITKYETVPYSMIQFDTVLETDYNNGLNIRNSRLYQDEKLGWVREMNVDIRVSAKNLSDELLTEFGLIPQSPSDLATSAFYSKSGIALQSVEYITQRISIDELTERIAKDEKLWNTLPELRKYAQAKAKDEELAQAKAKEEAEKAELQDWIRDNNLAQPVANILNVIRKNKEAWGFNYWRIDGGFSGNDRYFRCRMKLIGDTSVKDVIREQATIESQLRRQILIKKLSDKGSFDMTILLNSDLDKYSMKMSELKELGEENKILIGKGITGDVVTTMNNQANHIIVTGKSGSGKSVEILALLSNLVQLKDFDFKNVLITSSSKVGDFGEFKKSGAYVASGLDEIIKVARKVLEEAENREKMFADANVSNLWEFNKKYPDKKMGRILFLVDELENALNSSDNKKSKELESLIIEGLNIYRSSGIIFIGGGQNALKSQLGVILDKMTIKYLGNNNKNIVDQFGTELSEYFKTADSVQGRFFVAADNLKLPSDSIEFGESGYTLVQTPYISDISKSNLPELKGQEFMYDALAEPTTAKADESVFNMDID